MASKKPATQVSFCANCGQLVAGPLATRTHDPAIQFCWNCGVQLDDDGRCQNEDCKFYKKQPGPPPA